MLGIEAISGIIGGEHSKILRYTFFAHLSLICAAVVYLEIRRYKMVKNGTAVVTYSLEGDCLT